VVKFQLTNRDTKESYDKLWSRNRMALAITPTGDAEGIRISPHVYNSMADVERGVAAVREVARG
jgi:selenocysteine lyase/cysteine desulfurase